MALYGQVSTFDNGDDCTQYIERLDYYFVANGIEETSNLTLSRRSKHLSFDKEPGRSCKTRRQDLQRARGLNEETPVSGSFRNSSTLQVQQQNAPTERVCLYLCRRTSFAHSSNSVDIQLVVSMGS